MDQFPISLVEKAIDACPDKAHQSNVEQWFKASVSPALGIAFKNQQMRELIMGYLPYGGFTSVKDYGIDDFLSWPLTELRAAVILWGARWVHGDSGGVAAPPEWHGVSDHSENVFPTLYAVVRLAAEHKPALFAERVSEALSWLREQLMTAPELASTEIMEARAEKIKRDQWLFDLGTVRKGLDDLIPFSDLRVLYLYGEGFPSSTATIPNFPLGRFVGPGLLDKLTHLLPDQWLGAFLSSKELSEPRHPSNPNRKYPSIWLTTYLYLSDGSPDESEPRFQGWRERVRDSINRLLQNAPQEVKARFSLDWRIEPLRKASLTWLDALLVAAVKQLSPMLHVRPTDVFTPGVEHDPTWEWARAWCGHLVVYLVHCPIYIVG